MHTNGVAMNVLPMLKVQYLATSGAATQLLVRYGIEPGSAQEENEDFVAPFSIGAFSNQQW